MNTTAKILVPNKVWLLEDNGKKLGTLNKEKKGYSFFRKGEKVDIQDLATLKASFGEDLFNNSINLIKSSAHLLDFRSIYGYPCRSKPFNPVYNIKKRLPIYAKSSKSKSLFCAGYYIIKFRKGWVRAFCPKLITLERYPYQGPFKTELEMKTILNQVNKHDAS